MLMKIKGGNEEENILSFAFVTCREVDLTVELVKFVQRGDLLGLLGRVFL